MPQRAPPSRPFASAPNRAGPTRLFASVPKSLSTSTVAQERSPRRAANEPWGVGTDEGDAADDAAAHRAALALDEPPGCPVAPCNFRVERGAPKDCARTTAVQSPQTASLDVLAATCREGARAHATAADAVSDPGSITAFVELIHLRALLEAEGCFPESSGMAIEQPQGLQHDHALVEARWRAGVIGRRQGRAAKLQSVIADTDDATSAGHEGRRRVRAKDSETVRA